MSRVVRNEQGPFNMLMESLNDLLSDFAPIYHPNKKDLIESCNLAEQSASEYLKAIKDVKEEQKLEFTNLMIDIFIKDNINFTDLQKIFEKKLEGKLGETMANYATYVECLPESEQKAFYRGWIKNTKKDFQHIYKELGISLSKVDIETEYEMLLVSQAIFHRLIIDLNNLLTNLNKKRSTINTLMSDFIQINVAVVRVAATAQGRMNLDDLYRTYSRLKTNEPLCQFYFDGQSELIA
jgi:hypothetical protein